MRRTIRLSILTGLAAGALALPPAAEGADVTLDPTSLSFGSQQIGTTGTAQSTTLTLDCDGDPMCTFFPFISATPAVFSQTNDCTVLMATLISDDSCTINVSFAPAAAGAVTGTLSTGMSGPTAALSGTGVASPTVAPAPAPPADGGKRKCKKGKKKPKGASAAKKKKCGKKKRGR